VRRFPDRLYGVERDHRFGRAAEHPHQRALTYRQALDVSRVHCANIIPATDMDRVLDEVVRARVVFGAGRAKEAGRITRELNCTAALLMTDPTLHRLGIHRADRDRIEVRGRTC